MDRSARARTLPWESPPVKDLKNYKAPLGAFQIEDPENALVWLCVIVVWSWLLVS